MRNRLLAFLCAAAMMGTCLSAVVMPLEVFAEDGPPTSGTCEDNEKVTWSYDSETKTLTFSGEGELNDGAYPVWRYHDTDNVVIEDGITGIAAYTFGEYSAEENIVNFTIPESVTSIGEEAFYGCSTMTSIDLPKNLTSIGGFAFYGCRSLTVVEIPDGLTDIGEQAFGDCSSLADITIPDSVKSIGWAAFWKTPWLEAKQAEDPLVIVNGILIDANTCTGNVTIPEGVTEIVMNCFNGNSAITSVSISGSVNNIGERAFTDCPALTAVTILNPECSIFDDEYTFADIHDLDTGGYEPVCACTIRGYNNSTAQTHAEQFGYTFESLGEAPEQDTSAPPAVTLGDLDSSGAIDIMDVIKINKYLLGGVTLTGNERAAADVDGSGIIDATDSLNILKYVVKLITAFDAV